MLDGRVRFTMAACWPAAMCRSVWPPDHGIAAIDLLVVNLYRLKATVAMLVARWKMKHRHRRPGHGALHKTGVTWAC
jgi:AICAR transformylase/IMP cyclohydrolase PurH